MNKFTEELDRIGITRYKMALLLGRDPHRSGNLYRAMRGDSSIPKEKLQNWINLANEHAEKNWNGRGGFVPMTLDSIGAEPLSYRLS